MIIDFNINCNNYIEKVLSKYSFFDYICPNCGAHHSLSRHAKYKRYILTVILGETYSKKIEILRLKCSSCNTTHAVLPADTIPYCIYAYSHMLTAVSEYFIYKKSILETSDKFQISFQTLYSFISRFQTFLNQCIQVLRMISFWRNDENPAFLDVLTAIKNNFPNGKFPKLFFNETKGVFLMKKFLNILPRPISIGNANS